MLRLVSDIEGDGLLEEVTVIHCIVCKNIDQQARHHFYDAPVTAAHMWNGTIAQGIDYMFSADVLIGHNFIGYDLPAIYKLPEAEPPGGLVSTIL